MLGSSKCVLNNLNHAQLASKHECPYDPKGYFVVKGTEKVMLIQEQISKNRIIVEMKDDILISQVTSSTHQNKTRTDVWLKNNKFYLKQNQFSELIPIAIVFKGMGIESDQEIAQLIGTDEKILEFIALSIQEGHEKNVLTQQQALQYLGEKINSKINRDSDDVSKSKADEAFDFLQNLVIAHVECTPNNFLSKARYLALMV